MRRVYPPSGAPDRRSDCMEAIEPAVAQLVDRAEGAGWTRDEVLTAIHVLTGQTSEPDRIEAAEAA